MLEVDSDTSGKNKPSDRAKKRESDIIVRKGEKVDNINVPSIFLSAKVYVEKKKGDTLNVTRIKPVLNVSANIRPGKERGGNARLTRESRRSCTRRHPSFLPFFPSSLFLFLSPTSFRRYQIVRLTPAARTVTRPFSLSLCFFFYRGFLSNIIIYKLDKSTCLVRTEIDYSFDPSDRDIDGDRYRQS